MSTSTALEFVPTRGELSVVSAILQYARANFKSSSSFEGLVQIDSDTAVEVLQRSGLSYEDLAKVWSIADEDEDGHLSERELSIAVRLMGWAQSGKPVNRSFLNYSDGPLPTLKDIWEAKRDTGPVTVQLPPVNVHEKIEYHRAFREAGPVNGLLTGEIVRDVYIKSNLSYNQLDLIWNLIDTQQRGSLNNLEFVVGMYLIQAVKTCQLTDLPASIPSYIYDQLSLQSPSPFATPLVASKSAPLPWKSPSASVKHAITQSAQRDQDKWDVSVIEQAEANGHFAAIDAGKQGLIDGDESARYMLKFFKLPPGDIAHIWDLVDLRGDNKLNKEQLAVAVHLIHRKLEGAELPSLELPRSLVPPVMGTRAHSRRASAPVIPQKKPPPPPIPPALSRNASAPSLKDTYSRATPTPRRPPPSRPDPRARFSTPSIPELTSLDIPSHNFAHKTMTASPVPLRNHDQETIAELKGENNQLKSRIEQLEVQLKTQNQYREQSEVLKEENSRLRTRLQDMEVSLSQALHASEGADMVDDLSREVARLTVLLVDHEHTETELRETLHSITELTQEIHTLKEKFADLEQEKSSKEKELEEMADAKKQLQGEKDSIGTRLAEMEKLLADPQTKGSSRRELQMLLKDVTKENEKLKLRERRMQESMTTLLTNQNQARVDGLERENAKLQSNLQELKNIIHRMQSSMDDNSLHRQIRGLQSERDNLTSQIAQTRQRLEEIEGSSQRRIEELQRRCSDLTSQNEQLGRRQGPGLQREDESVPPPAYEEISIAT